ncbi:MAG TPA: P-loop NTPase fold protein [Leptolyngbyaceae cyanobacterium]
MLDFPRFFKACNPSRTLMVGNAEDRQYYIDFASVRGGKIIEELGRTITRISPEEPTCQLFTGHIGCGKSTELQRLRAQLEQQGFHVVYFESSQDLDMADVDITDILLSVARQVSASLEAISIKLKPSYFVNLFQEVVDFLQTPIDLAAEAELSLGIGKITAKTQAAPKLRHQLRQYLEPRTNSILQSINEELLGRAKWELKRRGKEGLVVIIDNLDRVDMRPVTANGRSQPEYLFIDRGEQLQKLNCHVVYTIPLSLIFSNDYETLKNRLGGGLAPKVLPMVQVKLRDGRDCPEGMALLRQLVLARAFPGIAPETRVSSIAQIFDSVTTLDRLCRFSGGHVRNLLGLLYSCLQREDPPISRECLETVIARNRDDLVLAIDEKEWDLLFQVVQLSSVRGEVQYQTLLRSMFVYEYRDSVGRWFGVNPALAETEKYKSWQQQQN